MMKDKQSNKQKRVVIYNRVAAPEQTDKQATKLTAVARQLGYEPVVVYSDKCSGRIRPFERPKLRQLIRQVEDTRPTAILVAHPTKISRNMGHMFEFMMWVTSHRLELIVAPSLNEGGVR